MTAKHVHEKLSRELAVSAVGTVGMVGGLVGGASGLTIDALSQVYGLTTGIGGFASLRAMTRAYAFALSGRPKREVPASTVASHRASASAAVGRFCQSTNSAMLMPKSTT